MKPYKNSNHLQFKSHAFNDMPFNEVMITNGEGTKYHVMHKWRGEDGVKFDSLTQVFSTEGKYDYLWAERKASKGTDMWDNPNWAFNNRETDNDRCHDGRINVCKQTRSELVGHTGGGTLIGTACGGGSGANGNLWKELNRIDGRTFNCPDNGSNEAENELIDWTSDFHIFVRMYSDA